MMYDKKKAQEIDWSTLRVRVEVTDLSTPSGDFPGWYEVVVPESPEERKKLLLGIEKKLANGEEPLVDVWVDGEKWQVRIWKRDVDTSPTTREPPTVTYYAETLAGVAERLPQRWLEWCEKHDCAAARRIRKKA